MKKLISALALVFASAAMAQVSNPSVISVSSAPSGSCSATLPWQYNFTAGVGYFCGSVSGGTGTWTAFGSASGGDSITSPNTTITVGGTSVSTTLDINLGNANAWTAAQTFNLGITIASGHSLTNTGVTDGCATWATGVLGSTGTACGSGGGGTPGGSNTQIQYNNSGAFGGDSKFTTTGAGILTDSANGAASTSVLEFTGAPYSAGSGTTNFPLLYMNNGVTQPTGFYGGGTYLGINAPSGFVANFLDFYVNGTRAYNFAVAGMYAPSGTSSAPGISFASATSSGMSGAGGVTLSAAGTAVLTGATTPAVNIDTTLGFVGGASTGSPEAYFKVTGSGALSFGSTNGGTNGALTMGVLTATSISGLSTPLSAGQGGTGVANTATLTLGTSNVNFATFSTGIPKITTTTGAFTTAIASDFPTLNQNTTGTAANLAGCTGSAAGDLCYWTGSAWLHVAGNASGTAYLQETSVGIPSWSVPSGTGNTTSTSLTTGYIPKANGANSIINSALDDGATTANTLTYAGTGGISSSGPVASTPPSGDAGLLSLAGNTVNQTIPANQFALGGFNSASATAYGWQPSTTAPAGGLMVAGTPSSGWSAITYTTPGTNVLTAIGNNLSAAGGLTTTIASGTSALGTGAITSATCATVVTTSATNVATTDVVGWGFNGDPTAVTGYIPATAGMLTIIAYPSSGNVNFKVCNNTSSSITPGAITLNWRVTR